MTKWGGLALDTDWERLLALLSVAARRPISADILGSLEAAAGHWRRGDKALANFRLIFAGLPQLDDPLQLLENLRSSKSRLSCPTLFFLREK